MRSALTAAALTTRLGWQKRCKWSWATPRRADPEAQDPESVFQEACDVEVQRVALLLERLEACVESAGENQELRKKLDAAKGMLQDRPGGELSWREAFEAARQTTAFIEDLLEEARQESAKMSQAGQGADGSSSNSAAPRGFQTLEEPEEVRNLEGVAEKIIDDETVLRFIAVPVLGLGQGKEPETRLPSVDQVRRALGTDVFSIESQVIFDRVYILTGQVDSNTQPAVAFATLRKRLASLSTFAELFLQPTMDPSQSALLVMLQEDMPSSDFEWWQWILCGFSLASVVSVNFEAFTVSSLTSEQFAVVSIYDLPDLASRTAPTAICILFVVAAMEAARRAAANKYAVVLTPPFLIPVWPIPSIGCFGAITRRLCIVPNEEANLAMSVSAGLTGYLVALLLVLVGFALGPDQEQPVSLNYAPVPLVLKLLLRPLLGEPSASRQLDPFSEPVPVAFAASPVLIGGVVGLMVTSLNLLCLGRLDGAVLARSSLRSRGNIPGLMSFGVLAAGCLTNSSASYLYGLFGIYALVLQSGYNRPARDSISEPETSLSLTSVALVVAGILISMPGSPSL